VLPVPRSWSEIDAAWVTAALAERCPGAVVSSVDAGSVEDGTNRRASLSLQYSVSAGPPAVFVKTQGRWLHRLALVALRALPTEAYLAASGWQLPLESPIFYGGGFDRSRLATIVVMEDVTTRGCRPNDATRPLTVAEVSDGLENLARLHASSWDRPLRPDLSFLRPWRLGAVWAPVSAASLARGLRRLATLAPNVARPVGARRLEEQFRASARLAATGPQTVLHGDPHPGNTYAVPGDRTGFYDWQLVRTGHWSHDIGYFLAGSMSVEDRRRHDKDLLEVYLDALGRAGVTPPTLSEAWSRYRASPAFGLATWLHTLAAGSFQQTDVCVATIERFATAYADLETHNSLIRG
jgi:hypothetical protein